MDLENCLKDLINIQNNFNSRLTQLHWFYSPFHFIEPVVDSEKVYRIKNSDRKPVLVLDRNIFTRLISVVSEGRTKEGSTRDIAVLIAWAALNDIEILPYYALNEFADGMNDEETAQKEYSLFKRIYKDITLFEWIALALGLEEENKTLLAFDENAEEAETVFCNTSVDYLTNYAAMLHLSAILITEKDRFDGFRKYFEWLYNNLKVSRYTEIYAGRLFAGGKEYKEPKKIHGKDYDRAIRGIQNQARDLSYLTQLSIDRWPINEYEPILVTDDRMLGDIFLKGCFNRESVREFEKNIKTSNKKASEWVDELLLNHKEVVADDYSAYCREVIDRELCNFKAAFDEVNNK